MVFRADIRSVFWYATTFMSSNARLAARQYHLIPPVVEQPQYNLFSREKVEKEFQNLYTRDIGLGIVGYRYILKSSGLKWLVRSWTDY